MQVYLDNSATTQPLPEAIEAMMDVLRDNFGNPSSGHSKGRTARGALTRARTQVAEFIMTDPDRVVFTSGATEANDAVLRGAFQTDGRKLITTAGEHPSTQGVFAAAPDRMIQVPLNAAGTVDLTRLFAVMEANPGALLAIGWVSGETGVVQPVAQICRRARTLGVATLIDGAQAPGRLPRADFDVDYDFLSVSAHKLGGPKGTGCLVLGEAAACPQLASGGGQEQGRRSGTENLPGIAGFGAACAERSRTLEADLARMGTLRNLLETGLAEMVSDTRINGADARRVPTNTNITLNGVDGMALVARCDARGIQFSQVSACSTGKPEPSRTLTAMGLDERAAFASVRFSVSTRTTETDIAKAVEVIGTEARTLRALFGETV